jgi:hypothetical protein
MSPAAFALHPDLRNDPIKMAFEHGNVLPLDTVRRSHVMLG